MADDPILTPRVPGTRSIRNDIGSPPDHRGNDVRHDGKDKAHPKSDTPKKKPGAGDRPEPGHIDEYADGGQRGPFAPPL